MRIALILAGLALFPAFSTTAQKNTVPKERWSNEKIWYSATFRSEGVFGIRSMADGVHYTSLEYTEEGNAVVKYAYRTGEAVDTLAKSVDIYGGKGRIDGYQFSADEQQLLVSSDHEGIYRHSYTANYHVYRIGSGEAGRPLLSDGTPVRLATFSPAGDKVAYVRDNDLWVVNLDDRDRHVQLTQDGKWNYIINGASDWVYEEEFGKDRGFFWSPDGQYIAYYRFDESAVKEFSMPMYGSLYPDPYTFKYPKAGEINSEVSIHAVEVSTGRKTALARVDGDNYIPRIKWMGDTDDLMVMRMNRHQSTMELLRFDLGVMASREQPVEETLFVEESETHVPVQDNFTFLSDGTFLMTSMMDGYNHLYHVKGPEDVNQLTEGAWDITSVQGYDAKRKVVYFSSSMKGATQEHLAKVDLKGRTTVLDEAPGTHGVRWSKTFDYAIHDHSDAETPSVYVLRDRKWKEIRMLRDNAGLRETLADYSVAPREFFTFKDDAGEDLNCWMMKPTDFDPEKEYPVYVAIYGGPGVNTVNDSWGGTTYYWHNLLCQEGYIVVSCDPRGTPKRGRDFEHSTYLQLGKLETEDFIDLAEHLSAMDFIDGDRIGIQGWSYGGYMTLLAMTKGAEHYAAGISVAPVSNWRFYDSIYTERFMRTPQENADGYDDNSPINHADKLEGPLLLVHGSADDNVHFQNAMEMVDALVGAGKDFDFFAYPNRNHGIYGGNTRLHLFDMMLDFLRENL
jgi:dipeptidyl-peptidase-4